MRLLDVEILRTAKDPNDSRHRITTRRHCYGRQDTFEEQRRVPAVLATRLKVSAPCWAHTKKGGAGVRRLLIRASSYSEVPVLPAGYAVSASVPDVSPAVAHPPRTTAKATSAARMNGFIFSSHVMRPKREWCYIHHDVRRGRSVNVALQQLFFYMVK
jgi:hypothetical protein